MQTFETAAIVSLIDHLSGPLRQLAGSVASTSSGVAAHADRMTAIGRNMTYQVTVPAIAAMKHMSDQAVELDKIENNLRGTLLNRARTMDEFKNSTREFAKEQLNLIDQYRNSAFNDPNARGMFNAKEWQESVLAGVKAGHEAEAASAIAQQAAILSASTNLHGHEAADALISLSNAFGIATRKVLDNGKTVQMSFDEVSKGLAPYVDLVASMQSNAAMTGQQAVDALKLPGPLAHVNHMDPGFLGAMIEAQAEKGVKGSEAGVALRSFIMAASAMKSTAVPMLQNAGIDVTKLQKRGAPMSADDFIDFERMRGINGINTAAVKKAFADAEKARGDADGPGYTETLWQGLQDSIKRTASAKNPMAPDKVLKEVASYFQKDVRNTDIPALVLAMRDLNGGSGPTLAQGKQFGEGRQVTRWTGFLNPSTPGQFDPFDFAMKRMYGENWRDVWREAIEKGHGEPDKKYLGNAVRLAKEQMEGLAGSYRNMSNSFSELTMSLYKAGVFQGVADGLHTIAGAIHDFSNSNPETLRSVAKGLVALAAVGPAMYLGGTLLKIGAGLTGLAAGAGRLMGVLAPLAGTGAGAAGGAAAGGAAAAATSVLLLADAIGVLGVAAAAAATQAAKANADAGNGPMGVGDPFGYDLAHEVFKKKQFGPYLPGMEPDTFTSQKDVIGDFIVEQAKTVLGGAFDGAKKALEGKLVEAIFSDAANNSDRQRERQAARSARATNDPNSLTPAFDATKSVNVQGDVKGSAELHNNVTITVQPSTYFQGLVQKVESAVSLVLSGKLGQTESGSNAAKASTAVFNGVP